MASDSQEHDENLEYDSTGHWTDACVCCVCAYVCVRAGGVYVCVVRLVCVCVWVVCN